MSALPVLKDPLTVAEMKRLARKGVRKVDLMGPRGTTLITMDEAEAMACALVASGYLEEDEDNDK